MYAVALLVERPLSRVDAELVTGLHDATEEEVRFHVVVPERAGSRPVEAILQDVAMAQGLVVPPAEEPPEPADGKIQALQVLEATLWKLHEAGATAQGEVVPHGRVLDVVAERVAAGEIDELVVLTRPHLVSEALHRDLASRARRRLALPVLRLLAHSDPD